jgi:xylulokinase
MLIGIDIGTTSVKAALFDDDGRVAQSFSQSYATQRPRAGYVEQDTADWLRLVDQALFSFSKHGSAVDGIGLCSQVNTHVFVDADGNTLLPAITWQDTRASDAAVVLDRQISADQKMSWWGAPLPIDASHHLARMAHVRNHEPGVWAKTRQVIAPKDFVLRHLTGHLMSDPLTNFGLIDQSLNYVSSLQNLVAGAAERLPKLAGISEIVSQVRAGLPFAGTPVVTGTMDAWAGMLGAGVCEDGDGLYLSGTSEILGIVSRAKAPTPGVIAFPPYDGIVLHAGPTQSGGASVAWLSRLLSKSPEEISSLAENANLGHTPLFLPHLEGERAPLWDPTSRGSFAGITSSTGAPEMARAVLEGVAYSARLVMQSLAASACVTPKIVHHSGGGSASDIWCQIRADVLGVPLKRTASHHAGVIGAAVMAGVGIGQHDSLRTAAKRFVQFDRTFMPDQRAIERHDKRFKAYQDLYAQLKPVTASLG